MQGAWEAEGETWRLAEAWEAHLEDEKGPVPCPQTYFSPSKNVFTIRLSPEPLSLSWVWTHMCVSNGVGWVGGHLGVSACMCLYVQVCADVLICPVDERAGVSMGLHWSTSL